MNILASEERDALRESVHRLMTNASTEAAVRVIMETPEGYDSQVWRQLGELGVIGLIIDEQYGGSGVSAVELEAIMEETGAQLLCSPLLGSGVLTGSLLQALGEIECAARLLPQIASGECIAASVLTGDTGCWSPAGVAVSATEQADGWQLEGRGSFVLHGQNADVLIVLAQVGDGLGVFEVNPGDATITALPTLDRTLRLAAIDFSGTSAQLISADNVWPAVEKSLAMSLVALAGEQAGGARKVLDATVEYASTRVQFGRLIGSFQAIKHMAADLLIEVESATSAARHAALSLAEASPRADEAISLAAFACADAYVKTTADSIQMHGGIAFTWEHPAHLYFKRARSSAQLFGASDLHRENYLKALGA